MGQVPFYLLTQILVIELSELKMARNKSHSTGLTMQTWLLHRWFFLIDAFAILTPEIRYDLIITIAIGILFFSGIGRSQIAQDLGQDARSEINADSKAIAVLNSEMGEKERRLELVETKLDIVIAQNSRIEAREGQDAATLSWIVRLFGLGIVGLIGKVFHEIWQRTINKRTDFASTPSKPNITHHSKG